MTIEATLTKLQTILQTVNPSPEPIPSAVVIDLPDQINLGDIPLIILEYPLDQSHLFEADLEDTPRQTYYVNILVIVGTMNTNRQEITKRARHWPEAIFKALAADVTLGGSVITIGNPGQAEFMTSRPFRLQYGNGDYFGLKIQLPVSEYMYGVFVS